MIADIAFMAIDAEDALAILSYILLAAVFAYWLVDDG